MKTLLLNMSNIFNKVLRWRSPFAPQNFSNKKKFLLLVLVLLFILVIIPFFPHLVIIDGETNVILYSKFFLLEKEFMIRYIHSIHLTPIEELYRINDKNIVLFEMHYDTYSVGMPSELNEGEVFEQKDGKFVISNMNRIFSNIDLRIGQIISNHTFIIDNEEIELDKITTPGSWIRFEVRNFNIVDLIKGVKFIE